MSIKLLLLLGFVFILSGSSAWGQVAIMPSSGTGKIIRHCMASDNTTKYTVSVTIKPGGCSSYTINWADGKTETFSETVQKTISHEYDLNSYMQTTAEGERTMLIQVTGDGCADDSDFIVLVLNKDPVSNPVISSKCEGAVRLTNSSSPTIGGVSFLWEMNGQTSSALNPVFNFSDLDATYDVKLTVTTAQCNKSSSKTVTFQQDKLPVSSFTASGHTVQGADSIICLNSEIPLSLDGTSSNFQTAYTWSITGGRFRFINGSSAASSKPEIVFEQAGTYKVNLTARNACGNSRTAFSRTFKVWDKPSSTIPKQPDVCDAFTYKISTPLPGAEYTVNGNVFDPAIGFQATKSADPYIVEAKLSNLCGNSVAQDTFFVVSVQEVKITSIPNEAVICVNGTPLLLEANLSGGTWKSRYVEVIDGKTYFNPKETGSFEIVYEIGVNQCLVSSKSTVKVEGTNVTATNQSFCKKTGEIELKASHSGGNWTTNDCTNCVDGNIFKAANLQPGTYEFHYSIPGASGSCSSNASSLITINNMKAGFELSAGCSGDLFVPKNTSEQAKSYKWFVNNLLTETTETPQFRFPAGESILKLVILNGACSDTLEKRILVADTLSSVNFDTSVRSGCTPLQVGINLTEPKDPDVNYQWSINNTVASKEYQLPQQTFSNDGILIKNYIITLTAENGCGSTVRQRVVSVSPQISAEIGVDLLAEQCSSSEFTFSNRSIGHNASESVWNFGDGSGNQQLSGEEIYHSFKADSEPVTYKVTLNVKGVCGTDSASTEIKVLPSKITPLFNMSNNQACAGEKIQFTDATVPKPEKWFWDFGDGVQSTVANPVHQFADYNKSYTITMIAYTACGTDTIRHVVQTLEEPKALFDISAPETCQGNEVLLSNLSDPQLSFVWDFGDNSTKEEASYSATHVYSSPGKYTVSLTAYRNTLECKSEQKKSITIESPVKAAFQLASEPLVCSGNVVQLKDLSTNADTWSWQFTHDGQIMNPINTQNPSLPLQPGFYSVKLIASRRGICSDSVEQVSLFKVENCEIKVPDAFTPNQDGVGDKFTLFGSGIKEIRLLRIRNRWGEVVFEAKDIPPGSQLAGEAWDGTFRGKAQPPDMYIYEAEVLFTDNLLSKPLRGNFYLIR